jgi:hypothetical protein
VTKNRNGARRRPRTTPPASRARASASSPSAVRAGSGGLLGRVLGPPVPASMSRMPRFRDSLGQGFLLVASSPVLLFGPIVFVFAVWLILLALGFVGSGGVALSQMAAMPPISTAFDVQNAVSIAGPQAGLIASVPLLLVRAVFVGVLAGLLVEGFESGGATGRWGAVRGLAAFPLTLAAVLLSFVGLFVAQFASILGPGLGTLFQVLVPAFVLYALGFVPFSAVRERRPLAETIRRSYAAARTPGGRHASFCILYVLVAFVLPQFIPGRSTITANLEPLTWVGLCVITYVHVGFTAAMAHRWLAVEPAAADATH